MTYKSEKNQTCCFIGHRDIEETDELKKRLYSIVEKIIVEKNADTFLFGSKSKFNDLCYETVTLLKEKYPYIKRVYVRAEFPYIDEEYENYLLGRYEKTYYPKKIIGAGKAVYVERNCEMIDNSTTCVVYYDESYTPMRKMSKSGTKIAYDHAVKKGTHMINVNNIIMKG